MVKKSKEMKKIAIFYGKKSIFQQNNLIIRKIKNYQKKKGRTTTKNHKNQPKINQKSN